MEQFVGFLAGVATGSGLFMAFRRSDPFFGLVLIAVGVALFIGNMMT